MKHRTLIIVFVALLVLLPACQTAEYEDEEESGEYTPLLDAAPNPALTLCTDPQPSLITDLNVYQTPDLSEPSPHVPFRDPVFGTCLVRVTDHIADLAQDDVVGGLKNEYSRVQSFNADGSLIVVKNTDGWWYLYDAVSLQSLGLLPVEDEPRWDANDPDLLYFTNETRLMSFNVRTGDRVVVHDFTADLPQLSSEDWVWTRYEGTPSYDGRYWGVMAEKNWETIAFLIYDLQAGQVVASRNVPGRPEIDHVTISSLGNYFLAPFDDYCEHGSLGDDAHPCGLMVYDSDLQNGRSLLRIVGHYDTVLDANGQEVIIYQDIDTDHISMLDLATGETTDLFPIDFSHSPIGFHFSGRASSVPGWALISTYSGGHPTDHTWMDDGVFAVELKAGGRVVRLAHTHALVNENEEHDYWAEPHASVNQDFTRILFTTNWGRSGSDQVDMIMIVLPPEWWELLP